MTAWAFAQPAYGQPNLSETDFGQATAMWAPLATDELLKMFEEQANDAAASASASRQAAREVTDRYAQITDRVKSANDALMAEMTTVQEQLVAEVSAAMNSPLVERSKRAYQAMLAEYSREVAAATSGAVQSRSELESATRRAADAYARATADLSAELVRQLPAAYERYLTSVVNVAMDADLSGLVAAGNEELLDAMARAYRPGADEGQEDEAQEGESGSPVDAAEGAGLGEWEVATPESDEALWASARTDSWGSDDDDEGWATATTPTVGNTGDAVSGAATDSGATPWGPVGTGLQEVGLPEDDIGLAPWGSGGVFGAEEAGGSAGAASEVSSDQPADVSTAKKSATKKSTAKKSTAKKSATKKSAAKKATAKKSATKKSTAKKSSGGDGPRGSAETGN